MTAGLPKRKSVLIATLIILLGVLVGAAATLEQKRSSVQNHAQARTCSAYQKMTQSQTRHQQHALPEPNGIEIDAGTDQREWWESEPG